MPEPPSEIDSAPVASVRQKSPQGYKVFASPATKHLAKENNINLADVTGTGPEGRITRGKLKHELLAGLRQTSHWGCFESMPKHVVCLSMSPAGCMFCLQHGVVWLCGTA